MANAAPYEIIAQPYTLYIAPVGTPFPTLDEEPSGSWTMVGKSGDLNYTEKGVTVSHKDKVNFFTPLGSTGARKAFRDSEELKISLEVADVSLEMYAIALNRNTVTAGAQGLGTSGTKKVGLIRGSDVATMALLVRGAHASPYMDGVAQYQVPIAVQVGEPTVTFVKAAAAGLELAWMAMVDPDAASPDERFGILLVQTTEPGT